MFVDDDHMPVAMSAKAVRSEGCTMYFLIGIEDEAYYTALRPSLVKCRSQIM